MRSPSQSTSRPDKRRGRLVEQQDLRLAVDGAGDLDLLLHGEVEVADLGVEIDVEAQRSKCARDGALAPDRRRIMPVRPTGA